MTDQKVIAFREGFTGTVIEPSDDTYESERKIFNAMIDKHPRLIARCSTSDDVRQALTFAADSGLEIAVRGGGHSVAGVSVNDGGMVIDMRGMNQTSVDPDARTIKVGGGTVWGEFDAACKPHLLGTTGGRVTSTGVTGLTLGGGSGWMERHWGLACDNLLEVELMTVDGRQVVANESQNEELFWALHGGGGNFGIATSLTFRLHPIEAFSGGLMFFDASRGEQASRAYRDLLLDAPNNLGGGFGFLTAPPEEFVPEHLHSKVVFAIFLAYAGSEDELRSIIRPLLEEVQPEGELILSLPYHDFNGMLDDPADNQNWWTAYYHDELPDDMLQVFCDYSITMKPSNSQMVIIPWGGKVAERQDFPLANRHSRWVSHPFGVWEDPSENEERIAWLRGLGAQLQRWSNGGTYLNFIGIEGHDRVMAAFGPDNYKRLAAVKAEYDPHNRLRGNQNIVPKA